MQKSLTQVVAAVVGRDRRQSMCLKRFLLPEEQVSPQNPLGEGPTGGKNNFLPFLQINSRYELYLWFLKLKANKNGSGN